MAVPVAVHSDAPAVLPQLPAGAFVAFVDEPATRSRVETEVALALAGHAPLHMADGGFAAALETVEWPAGLGGLILDISDSPSPVADMAALMGTVPQDCVVLAIGEANDVGLFRDLMGTGVADYLVRPLGDGLLHKALEKALAARARELELRNAQAALLAAQSGAAAHGAADDIAPLVVACTGTRGGVGATTVAIALASMLGEARRRESLIVDLDLHYGSVMLALDLDPTDALQEALATPERVDNLFVDQTAQRKSEMLCALGAEAPPQGAVALSARMEDGAVGKAIASYQRRFRQIVLDVPRGDPLMQRHALEAATDLVMVCDLTLAGARDAMRLLSLAHEVAPQLRVHVIGSGTTDPKKTPIKLADLERSIKQKSVCQVAFDDKTVAAAINAGKPLNEAAPRSAFTRSLQPLVNGMLAAIGDTPARAAGTPLWSKLLKPKASSKAAPVGAGA
jgi:pilus assembly protein CpaE